MRDTIRYAAGLHRRGLSVKLALPIRTFNFKIVKTVRKDGMVAGGCFGFLSFNDRERARLELLAAAHRHGCQLSFTTYRDTNATFAAQIAFVHNAYTPECTHVDMREVLS